MTALRPGHAVVAGDRAIPARIVGRVDRIAVELGSPAIRLTDMVSSAWAAEREQQTIGS